MNIQFLFINVFITVIKGAFKILTALCATKQHTLFLKEILQVIKYPLISKPIRPHPQPLSRGEGSLILIAQSSFLIRFVDSFFLYANLESALHFPFLFSETSAHL